MMMMIKDGPDEDERTSHTHKGVNGHIVCSMLSECCQNLVARWRPAMPCSFLVIKNGRKKNQIHTNEEMSVIICPCYTEKENIESFLISTCDTYFKNMLQF